MAFTERRLGEEAVGLNGYLRVRRGLRTPSDTMRLMAPRVRNVRTQFARYRWDEALFSAGNMRRLAAVMRYNPGNQAPSNNETYRLHDSEGFRVFRGASTAINHKIWCLVVNKMPDWQAR